MRSMMSSGMNCTASNSVEMADESVLNKSSNPEGMVMILFSPPAHSGGREVYPSDSWF